MGRHRWVPFRSARLVNVVVAGMLVLMGMQVTANAVPVLKPHRLERSLLPSQNLSSGLDLQCGHEQRLMSARSGQTLPDHDFVYAILSVGPLVTDYTKAQIAPEVSNAQTHGFHLDAAVSPRGPPRTSS